MKKWFRRITDELRSRTSVTVTFDDDGTLHWTINGGDPPYTLPWGTVYPPNSCITEAPGTPRDACHHLVGSYTKRVFLIVNPRTGESASVKEPGGEFIPSSYASNYMRCSRACWREILAGEDRIYQQRRESE
jgi:hypothetical protein